MTIDDDRIATPERPRCPVANGAAFDPLAPEQAADPDPWLSAARAQAPVFYMPAFRSWYVTRYADQVEVLQDTETYSSGGLDLDRLPPEFRAVFPEGPPLVMLNGSEHLRLRRLAQVAFTPKLVEGRAEHVRQLANGLVDRFVADGGTDLVPTLAAQLPVLAIVDVVGAPLDRAGDFGQWAADRAALLSVLSGQPTVGEQEARRMSVRAADFGAWLHQLVDRRRTDPRDDLITRLIQAQGIDDEPALSTTEVVGLIATILSAGTSTTANFIPVCLRECLRRPEIWERLRADRSLVPAAVEEALRLFSSVRGIRRYLAQDTELGGAQLGRGEFVYLHLGSANHDDDVFADPRTFDIDRPNAHRHLAFGRFRHLCLGAPLARLEARIVLEVLLDRLPDLHLAEEWTERWIPSVFTPGLSDLPLRWTTAAAVSAEPKPE